MLFAWVTNQWLDQYEGSISIIALRVESNIYAQIENIYMRIVRAYMLVIGHTMYINI